jgi:hypothetical protein
VRRIEVYARRAGRSTLELSYRLEGELGRVLIPAHTSPRRADRLWEHTCFEVFLAGDGGGYYECNFSPSTEWAVYRFSGYREGMTAVESMQAPRVSVHGEADCLMLDAVIEVEGLPESSLRLALSAVVEETDGRLSFWALAHPSDKPDFHHADSFILALPGDATSKTAC